MLKKAWDNLCATFEKWHVDNRLQLYQEFYNLKNGGKYLWRKALLCKFTLTNFAWYVIFDENLAFTFLENLPPSLHTLWFCLEPIQMKCSYLANTSLFETPTSCFFPCVFAFRWGHCKTREKRHDQVCIKWRNHLQEWKTFLHPLYIGQPSLMRVSQELGQHLIITSYELLLFYLILNVNTIIFLN